LLVLEGFGAKSFVIVSNIRNIVSIFKYLIRYAEIVDRPISDLVDYWYCWHWY